MRRALFALLVVFGLVLSPIPAGADEATPVSGDWTYIPTMVEIIDRDGPNVFIYGEDVGTWTGSFTGTTIEQFAVVHVPAGGYNLYYGSMVFEGTVEDGHGVLHTGTMVIRTTGKQDPGTVEPGPGLWVGEWAIVYGTGELAELSGHGTFTGPSLDLDYRGVISFGG